LETTSASEYRAGQRRMVTLPSGYVFEIRKMSPLTFSELFNVIGVEANASEEVAAERVRENLVEVIKVVIPKCVVKPKIALEASDDEDVLSLEDLDMDDFTVLFEEISAFSGIGEKETDDRESFRI